MNKYTCILTLCVKSCGICKKFFSIRMCMFIVLVTYTLVTCNKQKYLHLCHCVGELWGGGGGAEKLIMDPQGESIVHSGPFFGNGVKRDSWTYQTLLFQTLQISRNTCARKTASNLLLLLDIGQ